MNREFAIAETESFAKKVQGPKFRTLYAKILSFVYPQLRKNPFFGPNIKKLKGEYSAYHRYRLGQYRLFYKVVEDKVMVFVVNIEHRKDAY